jgi:hypothetical protein
MEASGQSDALTILSQRKELPAPNEEEAGWAPRASLDVLEYQKISLCCQDLNCIIQPVVHHYTDCTSVAQTCTQLHAAVC